MLNFWLFGVFFSFIQTILFPLRWGASVALPAGNRTAAPGLTPALPGSPWLGWNTLVIIPHLLVGSTRWAQLKSTALSHVCGSLIPPNAQCPHPVSSSFSPDLTFSSLLPLPASVSPHRHFPSLPLPRLNWEPWRGWMLPSLCKEGDPEAWTPGSTEQPLLGRFQRRGTR